MTSVTRPGRIHAGLGRSALRAALRSALRATLRAAPLLAAAGGAAGAQEHDPRPLPSPAELRALPPDGGPEFNRLVFESSPYLRQHARNPVDWYPWGAEAFEVARATDRPVFLSVGYSTCHWCHVMERESFEDEEVAALLDEHFVCVKVDREERPDVDRVYMAFTQSQIGRGGWPMTVVLTPDGEPFFAGTYFPKAGRFGRPGLLELLPELARAWREQRDDVLAAAAGARRALTDLSAGSPGEAPGAPALERAYAACARAFDPRHGGFGDAPKFPSPHALRFLLRYHLRTGEAHALEMVETTLRALRAGGIFDQVGFGFHRYSTDARWLVPHFEKMLYDQALLAMAYVEAWQVTGAAEYRRTAEEVLGYVLRDLTSPAGAFHSAEDADSEGEEGRFYLWTLAELADALGTEDAALAAAVWGLTAEGNFRDEATRERTGRNVLHLGLPLAEHARRRGAGEAELARRLEDVRARLFERREARVRPLRDDKVLTDWNGLTIAALAKAAAAFDEPGYLAAARRAADFALEVLRDDAGRLYKRSRGGAAGLDGLLADYAYLAWGLVELYQAGFEPRYLAAAVELVDAAVEHFHDPERGGFFLAPDDGEELIVRPKDGFDGALPSGNAVMASNLLRVARFTGEARYEELARGTLAAFAGAIARSPLGHAQFALAIDFATGPGFEVVVAGDPAADDTRALLRAVQRELVPASVLLLRPEGDEPPPIVELAPYAAEQRARDGRATAYVCRGFTCAEPTGDPLEVLRALRAGLRSAEPRPAGDAE